MRKDFVLACVCALSIGLPLSASAAARVLLVDDDASGNNATTASKLLSPSDSFFRSALQNAGLAFDVSVVDAHGDGPGAEGLAGHEAVLWYTGASYGGSPDNRAVVSLADEKALTTFVQGGGTLILVSPGYGERTMSSDAQWDKAESRFVREVLGLKGGKGLAKRFEAGRVSPSSGTTYDIAVKTGVETQFTALNPGTAKPLYQTDLAIDASGVRSLPVAVTHQVGSGRVVYVAFTLENVAGDPAAAFGVVLAAAGLGTAKTPAPVTAMGPRNVLAPELSVTGLGVMSEGPLAPPRKVLAPELTVTGTGALK